jgi:D-threo-aldose 1-dehydrogenase
MKRRATLGGGINKWEVCRMLAERGNFDLFLPAGRYTLPERKAFDTFLPLCESRGFDTFTIGPQNSGLLATGARPGAFYDYDVASRDIIDRVNTIEAICRDHCVRMIDAAFKFPLLHLAHVSVIPGGSSGFADKCSSTGVLYEAAFCWCMTHAKPVSHA